MQTKNIIYLGHIKNFLYDSKSKEEVELGLKNNQWVSCDKDYLFKVQVLDSLFRGKFLCYLKHEFDNLILNNIDDLKSFNKFLEPLYEKTWITFLEPPKGKAENVIEYVGRYSFRVAISNEKIKNIKSNLLLLYKINQFRNGLFFLLN